jgi:signal transduction histidine kinase
MFVVRAGYSTSETVSQAALFLVECSAIIYLTVVVTRARRAAEEAAARARRAARLRDDLVAIVSHDLRNPLSSIRLGAGVVTTALKAQDALQAERAAATIDRSATRMGRLIEDLLDVARAEAGALRVSPRVEPAAPLLNEAIDQLRSIAEAKSIGLDYDGDGAEGVSIVCEGGRIVQVLSNLLGNAVKFTRAGGTVTVAARAKGRFLEVEVTDTGPGISAEQIPLVFERYWQSQRTGRAREGMGLGLAIARAFVEAHGGEIWVKSEVGKGTSFFFTVPREGAGS